MARLSTARLPRPAWGAFAALLALAGCAGTPGDEAPESVGSVEQAITCVTVQNQGPFNSLVEDAQIGTDPTDPTKATANYASTTQMITGAVNTEYRRIVLKFDLAAAGVPTASTITSASLSMTMAQSPGKTAVDVWSGTGLWSESSVTWSQIASFPGGGLGALEASVPTAGLANGTVITLPISPGTAQTWLSPATNTGLVLDHPGLGRTAFGSSEAATPANRPTLQVCYNPVSCSDGLQNQGETGVDCGGPCPTACSFALGTFDAIVKNPSYTVSNSLCELWFVHWFSPIPETTNLTQYFSSQGITQDMEFSIDGVSWYTLRPGINNYTGYDSFGSQDIDLTPTYPINTPLTVSVRSSWDPYPPPVVCGPGVVAKGCPVGTIGTFTGIVKNPSYTVSNSEGEVWFDHGFGPLPVVTNSVVYYSSVGQGADLQYSIDGGATWSILRPGINNYTGYDTLGSIGLDLLAMGYVVDAPITIIVQ